MRSWDHLSYGITQCYLPPDRGDSHAFTQACCRYSFIDPGRMKGWVMTQVAGYTKMIYPETVTHPSINRARRRVTTLTRDQRATTKPCHHQHCYTIWTSYSFFSVYTVNLEIALLLGNFDRMIVVSISRVAFMNHEWIRTRDDTQLASPSAGTLQRI